MEGGASLERAFRTGYLLLAAVGLASAVLAVLVGHGLGPAAPRDALVVGFQFGTALLPLARALTVGGVHRAVCATVGLALLLWAAGDLLWMAASPAAAAPSVPSLPDGLYLACYPLAYVAVMLLIQAQGHDFLPSAWLDGIVAGLGAAALGAAFAVDTILGAAAGGSLTVLVGLAYPLGDLVLLALAVGALALLGGRWDRRWLVLATGCALWAVTDTVYLFQTAAGSYREGTVLDAGWPVALFAMSWSVAYHRPSPPAGRLDASRQFLLPAGAAAAALGILVYGDLYRVGPVAVGLATATLLTAGLRVVLAMRDLRSLAESRRLALTDDLTGLGNRRLFGRDLEQLLARAAGPAPAGVPGVGRLALLLLDLNRFKEINDSFGHPAGDELLRQIGPRLHAVLRRSDTIARLGGDEFAAVLSAADGEVAVAAARRITEELQRPFTLGRVSLHVTASIGIARYPQDATDAAGLLRCADVAMYAAKAGRRPHAVYDADRDDSHDRLRLAEDLRAAIRDRELHLHYQPQLDLRSGVVRSVEALVRWRHPDRGAVPAETLVRLAEETDLIGPLAELVLDLALGQCARWRSQGRRVVVAVNLSAINLADPGLVEQVRLLLARHRLPGDALVLEVTESTLMIDPVRAQAAVRELRLAGVTVSIDDFGTAFSSLSYLRDLAVGEIKLDRSFITDLAADGNGNSLAITRSVVELGHALRLRVVAEGIEDPDTAALLARLGVDLAQGYHIGRPVPADQLDLSRSAIAS